MELAGRPLGALHQELGAAAEGVLDGLLAAGYGRVAHEDGWLLWACRQRGDRYAPAAEQLAAQMVARRAGDGSWPRAYIGAGAGGALALAGGLGPEYGALAREVALQSLVDCDRADYIGVAESGQPVAPGARCLGEWAQILVACGELLRAGAERELQIAAARAVAAIVNYHYHPDLGLLVEVVSGDFFRFDDHRATFVHSGAALKALAALVDEAGRGGEEKLLTLAGDYLRQHLAVAWDPITGGIREVLVGGAWSGEKTKAVQAEALIALAALVGYRGGDWEVEWFGRVYAYLTAGAGVAPLVQLRYLVHCAASLDDLIKRAGHPAEWLSISA